MDPPSESDFLAVPGEAVDEFHQAVVFHLIIQGVEEMAGGEDGGGLSSGY